LIRAGGETVPRIVREAKRIQGVVDVYPVFGRFDVVALLEAKDLTSLKQVTWKVAALEDIRSTETLVEGD